MHVVVGRWLADFTGDVGWLGSGSQGGLDLLLSRGEAADEVEVRVQGGGAGKEEQDADRDIS